MFFLLPNSKVMLSAQFVPPKCKHRQNTECQRSGKIESLVVNQQNKFELIISDFKCLIKIMVVNQQMYVNCYLMNKINLNSSFLI